MSTKDNDRRAKRVYHHRSEAEVLHVVYLYSLTLCYVRAGVHVYVRVYKV